MLNFVKIFYFIFGLTAIVNSELFHSDSTLIERFKKWSNQHKIISKNDEEYEHIFNNWLSNDKYIIETNAKNLSFSVGHNAFSGMNSTEFSKFMGFESNMKIFFNQKNKFLRGNINSKQPMQLDMNTLPTSIDWREKNVVTGVKNQGSCGSCYSFSSTGALEGIYAIKYGNLVSFSEQEIVDCDNGLTKSHGCNGGMMTQVFDYVKNNGGLCSETDYPYISGTTQKSGTCQTSCKTVSGSKITKYTEVATNSDLAMMTALSQQPVSVAIQADQKSFQMYQSGVYTDDCETNLDHGVLLVGYGTYTNGLDYYILKNSWGTDSWGMGGYMYLGRGTNPSTGKAYNDGAGQCGVLGMGSYPSL